VKKVGRGIFDGTPAEGGNGMDERQELLWVIDRLRMTKLFGGYATGDLRLEEETS
jgi:hypothetical protein